MRTAPRQSKPQTARRQRIRLCQLSLPRAKRCTGPCDSKATLQGALLCRYLLSDAEYHHRGRGCIRVAHPRSEAPFVDALRVTTRTAKTLIATLGSCYRGWAAKTID